MAGVTKMQNGVANGFYACTPKACGAVGRSRGFATSLSKVGTRNDGPPPFVGKGDQDFARNMLQDRGDLNTEGFAKDMAQGSAVIDRRTISPEAPVEISTAKRPHGAYADRTRHCMEP